jgi:hypothetical protein
MMHVLPGRDLDPAAQNEARAHGKPDMAAGATA